MIRLIIFLLTTINLYAQNSAINNDSLPNIDMYQYQTAEGFKTAVDTTLTIEKYYQMNYLQKDIFGLQPFANEGQPYALLYYAKKNTKPEPSMGFGAQKFIDIPEEDIKYYNVPTPFSKLVYQSNIEQGQTLNSVISANINPQTNFFVGYRGLRSLGQYLHQKNSMGNFYTGGSYVSKNQKYQLQIHFHNYDALTQENGGITDPNLFEQNKGIYTDRERLNVYHRNMTNEIEGSRYYLSHKYNISPLKNNKLWIKHNLNYQRRYNVFSQPNTTENSYYTDNNGRTTPIDKYYGNYYKESAQDTVQYRKIYNKIGLEYQNSTLGTLAFYTDFFLHKSTYNAQVRDSNGQILIPNTAQQQFVSLAAQYSLQKSFANITLSARNSIYGHLLSHYKAFFDLKVLQNIQLNATAEYIAKIPELSHQFIQSQYVNYNWHQLFNTEKTTKISVNAQTNWLNLNFDYQLITDNIYLHNNHTEQVNQRPSRIILSPKQYAGFINYWGLKLQKDFHLWKLTLDNTLLIQGVKQDEPILNLPNIVTRNTLYYSDYFFQKALYLQTGIEFNYHTKYYADGYNPIVSDFYVQTSEKIGGFPVIDLFLNAKIQTAQIYFKLAHINAKYTGINYYTAPNYPFRELNIRFGIIWNFFD